MKRFYQRVTVVQEGAEYSVALDERPLNTPAKRPLRVPTRPLADEIAREWEAQGETLTPGTMVLTQLANTGLDSVPTKRAAVEREICNYALTDLVCYRADGPSELVARQSRAWQPLLDWAQSDLGAPLQATCGVVPVSQKAEAVSAISQAVCDHSDLALAGLHLATGVSGSVVIALALSCGEVDADTAYSAANVDELYQLDTWGADDEARARLDAIHGDLKAADTFFRLLNHT